MTDQSMHGQDGQQNPTVSWQEPLNDFQLLSRVWGHLGTILTSGKVFADAATSALQAALPPLQCIRTDALLGTQQMLLDARVHLMQTIKVLVPQAFSHDSVDPDIYVLADAAAAGVLLQPVLTLVELQLLLAKRAEAIRKELALRLQRLHQQGVEQQQQQQPPCGLQGPLQDAVSVSSSGSSDADLFETLE